MKHIWTSSGNRPYHRSSERRSVTLPARLTWKDQRGATRFATVVTRNVSEHGVHVECESAVSIPLCRLVQCRLERAVREADGPPSASPPAPVLSSLYRVSPPTPHGHPPRL